MGFPLFNRSLCGPRRDIGIAEGLSLLRSVVPGSSSRHPAPPSTSRLRLEFPGLHRPNCESSSVPWIRNLKARIHTFTSQTALLERLLRPRKHQQQNDVKRIHQKKQRDVASNCDRRNGFRANFSRQAGYTCATSTACVRGHRQTTEPQHGRLNAKKPFSHAPFGSWEDGSCFDRSTVGPCSWTGRAGRPTSCVAAASEACAACACASSFGAS